MKQLKRAITLLTLTAFLCSLQGCASSNTRSGRPSHNHYTSYQNPHSRPDFSAEPTQHYKKTDEESDSHSNALAWGVGTGAVIGIVAFLVLIPFAFASGLGQSLAYSIA